MKKTLLFLFLVCIAYTSNIFAQDDGIWSYKKEVKPETVKSSKNYKAFQLNSGLLKNELINVVNRKHGVRKAAGKIVSFPTQNGSLERFRIYEASVLSAGLQKKYPHIKSYYGISVSNPRTSIRLSLDDFGFHGLIHSEKGISYINPVPEEKDLYYIASKQDFKAHDFMCKTGDEAMAQQLKGQLLNKEEIVNDGLLRTYRIAIASTGEYSNYHINAANVSDGTDEVKRSAVLSAMNTSITRVNEVFERDLAVSMEIVATNDQIIYLDPDTDPFTNDDGDTLIDEIQDVIDTNIGVDNYDIGHVFSTGGGGIASVASVCTSAKARGVTGSANPVGDPFDIDFVAHEIGHQFGATHTFNNSCNNNRSDNTAVEPGSGSTLMAYAGICPPNVQGASDPFFHAVSIAQIWNNITDGVNDCATTVSIGNNAPVITTLNDYTIPKGTAFYLEGTATDTDGDILTYSWEQIDNAVTAQPPASDSEEGPAFRVRSPQFSSKRYFPREADILANNLNPTWEVISSAGREYNFALLVRDNNLNGGQTARDDVKVTADANSGPFLITSQTDNTTITGGDAVGITWDIANTNIAPVNATAVDIFLIIDEDFENLVSLATNTPNDGAENVIFPGDITTSNARILIKPTNNIFFAISTATLQIQQSEFKLDINSLSYEVCKPNDLNFSFTYSTFAGFNETTNFTATDVPAGLNVNFSNSSAVTNGTSIDVTVTGTENLDRGKYSFTINADASSLSKQYPIEINLFDDSFDITNLISPSNAATEIVLNRRFEWEAVENATAYEIEFSEVTDFSIILESSTVSEVNYTPTSLQSGVSYYWRVRPLNNCGTGNYSNTYSFSTITLDCSSNSNTTTRSINSQQPNEITSEINITDDGYLHEMFVNLDITHTYISDLTITLTSPSGTTITLINEVCGDGKNINATFSDEGSSILCGTDPAITGVIKPEEALASFVGEAATGTWILTVSDGYSIDGGSLNSFSLDICTRQDTDADGVYDPLDACPNTPANTKVDVNGCPVFSLPADNFSLKTIGESCINNNDGNIIISANEPLDYTATLIGTGVNNNLSFTSSAEFNNLSSGDYQLCFTVAGQPEYQQCFDLSITQPAPLQVISKVLAEEKLITLTLEGAPVYNIELNGITTQTTSNTISLTLAKGNNTIKVTTNKDCQGIFEEMVFLAGEALAYPNPFRNEITLFTGNTDEDITVTVASLNGSKLYSAKRRSDSKGTIPLDLTSLSTGVYIVHLSGSEISTSIKIVKE
ncbi:reprolysin-like metallopeptidase [Zhouia amylolytica]|uniref:P/Homo B domain-containing protein n=1 Tax=Zhouia amylolytica AD3 TaxID=1286632 RepID=W2UJW1_9FLAO|nr:zinc-dependent metalloprotease family protein [Zhouia amylolytica]ETN94273.1 hypothetical protein P278_30770 [Zhouia amylolytica AD3]